jgi:hypothetical protein
VLTLSEVTVFLKIYIFYIFRTVAEFVKKTTEKFVDICVCPWNGIRIRDSSIRLVLVLLRFRIFHYAVDLK